MQFFGGVIFFACITKFIPEPTLGPSTDGKRRKARVFFFSFFTNCYQRLSGSVASCNFGILLITEKWRRGR